MPVLVRLEDELVVTPPECEGCGRPVTCAACRPVTCAACQSLFKSLVATTPDVLYRVEGGAKNPLAGKLTFISPAIEALAGIPAADLLGSPGAWNGLVYPPDATSAAAAIRDIIKSRVPGRREFRIVNGPARETRWVTDDVTPLLNSRGSVTGWQGLLRDNDITHQIQKELDATIRLASLLRRAEAHSQMFPAVLGLILDIFQASGAALAVVDGDADEVVVTHALGDLAPARHTRLSRGEALTGLVIEGQSSWITPNVALEPRVKFPGLFGSQAAVCLPLVTADSTSVGALWVTRVVSFTTRELIILEFVSDLAATALARSSLLEAVQRHTWMLEEAYDATIEGWARALELRDRDTEGHTWRVTDLAVQLARECGLEGEELRRFRWGALLHDIGKMGIPDAVLHKPGPLDLTELDVMRQHPMLARDLLLPIPALSDALDIPYCHHERWDGSGYPQGLAGEEIPLSARIFAVADVWDAMTTDRPYRDRILPGDVIEHIGRGAGRHFDPAVIKVALPILGGIKVE